MLREAREQGSHGGDGSDAEQGSMARVGVRHVLNVSGCIVPPGSCGRQRTACGACCGDRGAVQAGRRATLPNRVLDDEQERELAEAFG